MMEMLCVGSEYQYGTCNHGVGAHMLREMFVTSPRV